MAFANFFDRSATAGSQVLANFRLEDFKDRLSAHLDLSVRLLARLYPTLAIHPVGSAAGEYAGRLWQLARSITDQIGLLDEVEITDWLIYFADTVIDAQHDTIKRVGFLRCQGKAARKTTWSIERASGNGACPNVQRGHRRIQKGLARRELYQHRKDRHEGFTGPPAKERAYENWRTTSHAISFELL
jgi:hypothetical protein